MTLMTGFASTVDRIFENTFRPLLTTGKRILENMATLKAVQDPKKMSVNRHELFEYIAERTGTDSMPSIIEYINKHGLNEIVWNIKVLKATGLWKAS